MGILLDLKQCCLSVFYFIVNVYVIHIVFIMDIAFAIVVVVLYVSRFTCCDFCFVLYIL